MTYRWTAETRPFRFPFQDGAALTTAPTLAASVPHTPLRARYAPLDCRDQAVPFHFKMVPPSPTAHTTLVDRSSPHPFTSQFEVPLDCGDQSVPFHFKWCRPRHGPTLG